jgi:hypothetical protein
MQRNLRSSESFHVIELLRVLGGLNDSDVLCLFELLSKGWPGCRITQLDTCNMIACVFDGWLGGPDPVQSLPRPGCVVLCM